MSVRNPWAATNVNTCTACCNVFYHVKFTSQPPLEWAQQHFGTPPLQTNATVRHYVVVAEAHWLGLRFTWREGRWEIKAVGAADVLKRSVLQPILHSLLPKASCFRIHRFCRELRASVGWDVLADLGLLGYVEADSIPILLPSACASAIWLARLRAHGQRFSQALPEWTEEIRLRITALSAVLLGVPPSKPLRPEN